MGLNIKYKTITCRTNYKIQSEITDNRTVYGFDTKTAVY